jgi:hypothetical protein
MIARPTSRRSRVQLSLQLSETPVPPDTTWETASPDDRIAVVAALARVMAKSIDDEEEDHD